ncbi:MAG: CHASE domain-containing protein [Pseudobdellovibrio sp.]
MKNKLRKILSIHISDMQMIAVILIFYIVTSSFVIFKVNLAIKSDIDNRLNTELKQIKLKIENAIAANINGLSFVKSFFETSENVSLEKFRTYVDNIDIEKRYAGIRLYGFAPIIHQKDIQVHQEKYKKIYAGYKIYPSSVGRSAYAPIVLSEPRKLKNKRIEIGFDLLSDVNRSLAIKAAIESNLPIMSSPLVPVDNYKSERQSIFAIYLPQYSDFVHETISSRNEEAVGMFWAEIRYQEFFEGALGLPGISSEKINFSIEDFDNTSKKYNLYRRFESNFEDKADLRSQIIQFYGRTWTVHAATIPNFYTVADKYLVRTIFFILLSAGILLYLFLTNKFKNLKIEKRMEECRFLADLKSQEQTDLLKKLNQMKRNITVEFNLDLLAHKFFETIVDLTKSNSAILFYSSKWDSSDEISIHDIKSIDEFDLKKTALSLSVIKSISTTVTLIAKSDRSSDKIFTKIFNTKDKYVDWGIIAIPSKSDISCGLLFLGRSEGEKFSTFDMEVIDNLVSQVGSGIDNAKLFKKVEDSNKAKTEFLANMSHEVRTPLNAIIGFSEMLCEVIDSDKKRNLINGIRKNGQQLTRIIDDILDLSKVEAGKNIIEKQRIRLSSVINEVSAVMEVRAMEKNISFSIESSGRIPSHIETDGIRLKQILLNLIGNSIKFTNSGSVMVKIHYSQNSSKDNILFFTITDTGIGISEENQFQLFNPFYQGDNTSTRRFGGTGLGLALSRKLAQQLGGDIILLTSKTGFGSAFEVKINCGDLFQADWKDNPFENELLKNLRNPSEQKLFGKHALLVEDSEDNQEIFAYFLKSAGATLDIVDSGLVAVEKAKEFSYDFILMDIQLPGIDGKEATRRIRKDGFNKPIIAVTAHASLKHEREDCINAGCNGQISKPVSGNDFIDQILNFLQGIK